MAVIKQKQGAWHADRVLRAIGRIGYSPASALLDIVDNSVSWRATKVNIDISIAASTATGPGRRKPVITSFSVVDNGLGMDEDGLDNALALGSSTQYYTEGTLSKFGLGLKSAAFSLGTSLEVVSRHHADLATVRKVTTDVGRISAAGGQYVYDLEEPSEEDVAALNAHCGDGPGTLVRISQIHTSSMPSVAEIEDGLRQRAGVVYYYNLSGQIADMPALSMKIRGEDIQAVDPISVSDAQGDLDERNWDGISVQWITRPLFVQIDLNGTIHAQVEIMQLPHPPSVEKSSQNTATRKETRDTFLIGAKNYGFYIYRNHRLISWADHLEGMVPMDKDLYGFHGRLLITSEADELLNIDVTKSRIQLSEIAHAQILPHVREATRKSKAAWDTRTRALRSDDPPHEIVNQALDEVAQLDEREDKLEEQIAAPAEKRKLEKRRQTAVETKPARPEETKRLQETGERVQYVDYLENNQLWERAHDPQAGLIVRVNKAHRFFREVYGNLQDNADVVKVLDTFLYALARGEYSLVYKSEHDATIVEKVMQDYREYVGAEYSELLRRLLNTVVLNEP